MTSQIVPVIISSTREIIGTASISPPDKEGKVYASIVIHNHRLLKEHRGAIEILMDKEV